VTTAGRETLCVLYTRPPLANHITGQWLARLDSGVSSVTGG
jgi:hypothetical protein